MLSTEEKEELKRIINKYVEQGRCFRPIQPNQALSEAKPTEPAECAAEQIALSAAPVSQ